MPKGRKRSVLEERQWLSEYEAGTGMEEIAKKARRATSTVWKGIEKARQEREARVVHEGLLRDAYQRHFEDLLDVAKPLKQNTELPSSSGILALADRRTEMLRDGLRSHIPDSPLWGACREWHRHSLQIEEIATDIKASLGELVDQAVSRRGSALDRGGWVGSLWFAIATTARGDSLDDLVYQIVQTEEGPSIRWGPHALSAGQADEAALAATREKHQEMVEQVTAGEMVSRLKDQRRRWAEVRDTIEEEVEVLRLRRLLPGRCKLCPQ